MKEKLIQLFREHYGIVNSHEIRSYFAPGRVNLIGEHIDYNGGFVFPCALDMGIFMLLQKRNDQKVLFASLNMPGKNKEIDLQQEIVYETQDEWSNYPKGILKYFKGFGIEITGLNILYSGNIPHASGLSSSAAMEVVTAYALNDFFGAGFTLLQLVQLSQKTEREFIGVNCGIMDQFSVGFGKKDAAMLLDCNTLEYQYIPLRIDGFKILICNTNKKRGLAESKYNERREECEKAVKALREKRDLEYLCDLCPEEFEMLKDLIKSPIHQKRAEHAVYENARVREAAEVLQDHDLVRFGQLMIESHNSLRDLYEVSCEELDILVEEALGVKGTLGTRMTGAGFGGCTVNLVQESEVEGFIAKVTRGYHERTGLHTDIYIAGVGEGVGIIC